VPVAEPVRGACELLGLDPMHVANEGILVAFVPPEQADAALGALRSLPEGEASAAVGRALAEHPGRVVVRTMVGARRVLDMLVGEQLPRIC
jgi:hydrogenase expression/formation protein HypE